VKKFLSLSATLQKREQYLPQELKDNISTSRSISFIDKRKVVLERAWAT